MLAIRSLVGCQCAPPSLVRNTPPETAAAYMVLGSWGSMSSARVRPPMLPGPREVQVPRDVPRDVPTDETDDVPSDVPNDVPRDVPRDVPNDEPGDVPSDAPEEPCVELAVRRLSRRSPLTETCGMCAICARASS